MPLNEDDLADVRRRVMYMLADTIDTFVLIGENAEDIFGHRWPEVRSAIEECLDDFWRNTQASGETHPEVLIYSASRENLQKAGFYGAQLDLKEYQVTKVNNSLRGRIGNGVVRLWRRPFKKWVDVINNFLGSLIPAVGMGEALKELKDCLRDELP